MKGYKYSAWLLALCVAASVGLAGCASVKKQAPKNQEVKEVQQTQPAPQAQPVQPVQSVAQPQQVSQVIYGYISGSDVILREGPSTSTNILDSMDKGYRVEILEEVKTGQEYPWYKIKTPKGRVGYTFGRFVSMTEIAAEAPKAAHTMPNGIPVPRGYQPVDASADYIVVRCAEQSMMGGPKYCYDKAGLDYCATTINNCLGSRFIVGGLDDEMITIYKSGRVSVKTVIGSNTILRYYKSSPSGVMNYSLGNLVLFKTDKDNGGWKRHVNGTQAQCGCGQLHRFPIGRDAEGRFVMTAREGVKDVLKNKW